MLHLQVDQLYPGSPSAEARYILRRGAGFDGGSFSLGVEDVEDVERGCNRPERNSGDSTCGDGPDQGELSRQLLLGQAWTSDVSGCSTAPSPTSGRVLSTLEDAVLSAPATLSEGEAVCLVIAVVLPTSADNLVQSDLTRLDLRLGLTDAVPAVEVLNQDFEQPDKTTANGAGTGTGVTAATALRPVPTALPFTGASVLAVALWATALSLLGWGLLVVGRRPRSS